MKSRPLSPLVMMVSEEQLWFVSNIDWHSGLESVGSWLPPTKFTVISVSNDLCMSLYIGIAVSAVIVLVFVVLLFILVGYGSYVRSKRKTRPPESGQRDNNKIDKVEPLVAMMARTR